MLRESYEDQVCADWPADALALTTPSGAWLTFDQASRALAKAAGSIWQQDGDGFHERAMAYLEAPRVALVQCWREFLREAWFPKILPVVDACSRSLMRGKFGDVKVEAREGLGRSQVELSTPAADVTFTGFDGKEDREGFSWGLTSARGMLDQCLHVVMQARAGCLVDDWKLEAA